MLPPGPQAPAGHGLACSTPLQRSDEKSGCWPLRPRKPRPREREIVGEVFRVPPHVPSPPSPGPFSRPCFLALGAAGAQPAGKSISVMDVTGAGNVEEPREPFPSGFVSLLPCLPPPCWHAGSAAAHPRTTSHVSRGRGWGQRVVRGFDGRGRCVQGEGEAPWAFAAVTRSHVTSLGGRRQPAAC